MVLLGCLGVGQTLAGGPLLRSTLPSVSTSFLTQRGYT